MARMVWVTATRTLSILVQENLRSRASLLFLLKKNLRLSESWRGQIKEDGNGFRTHFSNPHQVSSPGIFLGFLAQRLTVVVRAQFFCQFGLCTD